MPEIKIEKLINDGRGIGRDSDGRVWMVAGVIPGEIIRAGERKGHKSHVDGICERVITPASGRRPPPCKYFGHCGGCQMQHIDDHLQPGYKGDFIAETLLRSGGVSSDELARIPFDIIPAFTPFSYRQRVRLLCDNGKTGFRMGGSHRLVAIDCCLIARPALNLVLGEIRAIGIPEILVDLVKEIILEESPVEELVFVTMICSRKPRPREIKAAGRLSRDLGLENFFLAGADFSRINVGGDDEKLLRFYLSSAGGGSELMVESGGFCQVNQEQNIKLVNLVSSLAGEGKRILDLFCGAGNFSIPLAAVNEVSGFDLQRAAIRAAEINRKNNKVTAATRFFRDAAVTGLEKIIRAGDRFDLVILDPPRSGCREVMDGLVATGAEEIIYISCDPATLARDLQTLRIKHRYLPERIAAVDMFPQTRHVETVVKLSRATGVL